MKPMATDAKLTPEDDVEVFPVPRADQLDCAAQMREHPVCTDFAPDIRSVSVKLESTHRQSMSNEESLSQCDGGIQVRSVAALAKKYGFAAPDEWVGSESSHAVLDYGEPPVVLADSSQEPDPRLEEQLWESIFQRFGSSELSDHADSE
jgi:hypothetical protein